jgi:hypothetical protein
MIPVFKRRLFHAHRRRTAVFGVLALWISLGLQPCAAVMAASDDCPHCPPETTATHTGMHAHNVQEHCGGTAAQGAAEAMTECCEIGNAAVNSRSSGQDLKPLVTPVAATPPTESLHSLARVSLITPVVDPPDRNRRSVPLRKLYCVYRN